MTRIDQINERMAAIGGELDTATGDALAALEKEVEELTEERQKILDGIHTKQQLREKIAVGVIPGTKIEEETNMEIKRNFNVDGAEYRNAWLKSMMGKELDMEERTAVTATAAIPTQTFNQIVAAFKENKLLSRVSMTNFNSYIRIPVESSAADASWASTSTDSADSLSYVDLNAYQLIKTVEVPAQPENMSISAFETYLVKSLINKIETALQAAIISGDGSSKATGIATTVSTATGTFTKAAATKKDLLKIMGSLADEYQDNAVWVMPANVFYEECMNITDHLNFVEVNAGFGIKLFGHDVILDSGCKISSTDNIFYGDPAHYRLNLGEAIKVDKDTSAGFRSNSVVYRAVCLADGKLDKSDAFVRYTRAAS